MTATEGPCTRIVGIYTMPGHPFEVAQSLAVGLTPLERCFSKTAFLERHCYLHSSAAPTATASLGPSNGRCRVPLWNQLHVASIPWLPSCREKEEQVGLSHVGRSKCCGATVEIFFIALPAMSMIIMMNRYVYHILMRSCYSSR